MSRVCYKYSKELSRIHEPKNIKNSDRKWFQIWKKIKIRNPEYVGGEKRKELLELIKNGQWIDSGDGVKIWAIKAIK